MRVHDVARDSGGAGCGESITGNIRIVSIRPRADIVEKLRAAGLSVELKRLGRYVVPHVVTGRPPT